ncbi:MAG: ATP-binding cassette domain-containing protein [Candidatus Kaistia colombiensis]|nr:MAG: ATP-binding cassette domain-containing protein [Kaistia sp.]
MQVLRDINFTVRPGQIAGLVGESGSGKSTVIRCALGLQRPDSGSVSYDGIDVHAARGPQLMRFRREVQPVFQDPYASLNPRMTVERLIDEGLRVHRLLPDAAARRDRVVELLEMVGLDASAMPRHPRAFSGGQRQRIAIARALAIGPRLLICDEPVSALDVSVQAQVINLLQEMQERLNLAILFVAHDLAVVRHICSEVAVLERGVIVESGKSDEVLGTSQYPYTRALLEAVPIADPLEARRRRCARLSVAASPGGNGYE